MDLLIHSLMREDSLECDRLMSTEREREKIFDKDREMFESEKNIRQGQKKCSRKK